MLLRKFIQKYPNGSLGMMTPGGFVFLTPEQSKKLLAEESVMTHPGDPGCSNRISVEKLLSPKVVSVRRQDHVCHMFMDEPEKEELAEYQKEAAEISAARIAYEEITMAGGTGDYADYLLRFENPLEKIVDQWTIDQSEQRANLDSRLCYMSEEGVKVKKAARQENAVSLGLDLGQGVVM